MLNQNIKVASKNDLHNSCFIAQKTFLWRGTYITYYVINDNRKGTRFWNHVADIKFSGAFDEKIKNVILGTIAKIRFKQ